MTRLMRTARSFAFLSCILAAAACDVTGPDVRAQLQAQLDAQQASWAENGTSTYTMRIERHCECADQYDTELEVVTGEIVSGIHAFSGDPLTQEELDAQLALEDLFAVVQDALDRRVLAVSVQYNQDFGYVQRLFVDYDARTVSDDVEFIVTEYTPAASN